MIVGWVAIAEMGWQLKVCLKRREKEKRRVGGEAGRITGSDDAANTIKTGLTICIGSSGINRCESPTAGLGPTALDRTVHASRPFPSQVMYPASLSFGSANISKPVD